VIAALFRALTRRDRRSALEPLLPIGHLLGHVEKQLAIFVVGFAEQAAELVQITRLFTGTTPSNVVRGLALGEVGQLGRLLAVVEELIKWAFKCACQFFQRFDGRNGMAIFDARDITPEKAGTLLDITLGKFLFFAQSAKPVTDNHGLSILQLVTVCKGRLPQGAEKQMWRHWTRTGKIA